MQQEFYVQSFNAPQTNIGQDKECVDNEQLTVDITGDADMGEDIDLEDCMSMSPLNEWQHIPSLFSILASVESSDGSVQEFDECDEFLTGKGQEKPFTLCEPDKVRQCAIFMYQHVIKCGERAVRGGGWPPKYPQLLIRIL